METVKIKTLANFDPELPLPAYKTTGAAGADICACLDSEQIIIGPMKRILIPTGLSFEIPEGYEIQVRPRSGLSLKTGLMVVNSPGTIDSDYRGELKIILGNLSNKEEIIRHGDRIAQLVIQKVIQCEFLLGQELSKTERGELGFGSTGIQ